MGLCRSKKLEDNKYLSSKYLFKIKSKFSNIVKYSIKMENSKPFSQIDFGYSQRLYNVTLYSSSHKKYQKYSMYSN
jgi:hypothetical protein